MGYITKDLKTISSTSLSLLYVASPDLRLLEVTPEQELQSNLACIKGLILDKDTVCVLIIH